MDHARAAWHGSCVLHALCPITLDGSLRYTLPSIPATCLLKEQLNCHPSLHPSLPLLPPCAELSHVGPSARGKTVQLLNGLRVRMGLASGNLTLGTAIRSCSVHEAAKGERLGLAVFHTS